MSTTQLIASVPLVRAPATWPFAFVAGLAMLLLAALDFVGSLAAKEWADGGSPRWLLAGIGCFLVLFYVYASSLQYADLGTVTMGWIVLLQVGILLLDHVRYDVSLPPTKWVAIGLILVLQGYLLLAPTVSKSGAA
jgi:multidrug transporter EmrE-like cation transporter